ncbi:MAG TPA: GNAT family protein [Actinomycetota bacterium]|nr:GNAT family protein [Actinomycetota bacterium]
MDDEVFLRLHEERHAQELFQLVEKNRAHLRPWLPWVGATKSSEDTRRFIRELFLRLADGKEYGFGVLYRGELVGAIGLSVVSDAREAEVGYWLSEESQGRGIVSRATRALVLFSFVELGLNRVVITCAAENARSRAIPERLGFTLEATLREREVGGRDEVVYSLLRSEWDTDGA